MLLFLKHSELSAVQRAGIAPYDLHIRTEAELLYRMLLE